MFVIDFLANVMAATGQTSAVVPFAHSKPTRWWLAQPSELLKTVNIFTAVLLTCESPPTFLMRWRSRVR